MPHALEGPYENGVYKRLRKAAKANYGMMLAAFIRIHGMTDCDDRAWEATKKVLDKLEKQACQTKS